MPSEARHAYQQAMGAFDQNRSGLPDAFEQGGFAVAPPDSFLRTPASAPTPAARLYTPAGVEPDNPDARAGGLRATAFVVFILAAVFLVAAVVLVLFVVAPGLLGLR